MMDLLSFWTFGDSEAAPSPEIVAELTDISQAFAQDMGPLKLLPHERAQLKRIRFIARRDEKMAINALRVFKRRATYARRAMRKAA